MKRNVKSLKKNKTEKHEKKTLGGNLITYTRNSFF